MKLMEIISSHPHPTSSVMSLKAESFLFRDGLICCLDAHKNKI